MARCSYCKSNRKEIFLYGNFVDFEGEGELLDSPIFFKDKWHYFENCSDLEIDMASETSEWHICKVQFNPETGQGYASLVCERIYDKDKEYCAKHNKQCQSGGCGTREGVNSESYCRSYAKKCEHCQTRQWINSEGYCSEHQYKCGTCELRTNKEYCQQHTYACHVNNHYPPISSQKLNNLVVIKLKSNSYFASASILTDLEGEW